jgi:hypothetical protein
MKVRIDDAQAVAYQALYCPWVMCRSSIRPSIFAFPIFVPNIKPNCQHHAGSNVCNHTGLQGPLRHVLWRQDGNQDAIR